MPKTSPSEDDLRHEPIGPVLDLWEALAKAGGMPPLGPDHVRAIVVAFWRVKQEERRQRND